MRSTATSHTSIASLMHSQLVGRLDPAGILGGLLGVEQRDAGVTEALGQPRFASIDGESPVRTGVLRRQGDDLACPAVAHLGHPRSGHEVERRRRRADLVDRLQLGHDWPGGGELEQDDRTFDRNERVPAGRMHRPHRHVPGTRRVADVDRIAQQRRPVVPSSELRPEPGEPVTPHRVVVDLAVAGGDIDGERRGGDPAHVDHTMVRPTHEEEPCPTPSLAAM